MARLEILIHPDPRLRLRAEAVTTFDDDLRRFADDLVETLHGTGGIGLAATQVADRRAVVVLDLSDDGDDPQIYVNPEIVSRSVPGLVEESCLSIPGVVGDVVRATEVDVRARDLGGRSFERHLSGMHAVCMQHEVDHLEGRLFIDRLPLLRRLRLRMSALGRRIRAATPRPEPGSGVPSAVRSTPHSTRANPWPTATPPSRRTTAP